MNRPDSYGCTAARCAASLVASLVSENSEGFKTNPWSASDAFARALGHSAQDCARDVPDRIEAFAFLERLDVHERPLVDLDHHALLRAVRLAIAAIEFAAGVRCIDRAAEALGANHFGDELDEVHRAGVAAQV